jgi:hypothetical protein
VPSKLGTILSKNRFLSQFGWADRSDTYGTTLEYRRFASDDKESFNDYVKALLAKKGMPAMSSGVRKRLRESVFEIFDNAVIHSETVDGVFACGQVFPTKRRLDFCVADAGIGIRENVRKRLGLDLAPAEAIQWALTGRNTTKTGAIPGGLGLKLLHEFITMNGGRLQIATEAGYWESKPGARDGLLRELPGRILGTVVNIEVDMSDSSSYMLSGEAETDNVF